MRSAKGAKPVMAGRKFSAMSSKPEIRRTCCLVELGLLESFRFIPPFISHRELKCNRSEIADAKSAFLKRGTIIAITASLSPCSLQNAQEHSPDRTCAFWGRQTQRERTVAILPKQLADSFQVLKCKDRPEWHERNSLSHSSPGNSGALSHM
jgi:hypothetical protein